MKVFIRPLLESDAYISYKWRNDVDVFRYTGNVYTEKITLESELEWINRVIKNSDEYRCAIIAEDNYVGNIYLTDIKEGDSATYHIFIGEKLYWGKGVAKKASIEILKYGFDILGLKYVHLKVRPDNINALKLYQSLGFEESQCDDEFISMELNRDKCVYE